MKYLTKKQVIDLSDALNKISLSELNTAREKALGLCFELILRAGLRTQELISLKVKDIDFENGIIHIRSAKGSNNRSLPLKATYLRRLLEELNFHRLTATDYVLQMVWPFFNEGQARNFKRYLQDDWAVMRFKTLGPGFEHITLHSLRHSFAIRLIETTNDVFKVQRALGHKSLTSTQQYMTAMYERDMESDVLKAMG